MSQRIHVEDDLVIQSSPETIWDILDDTSLLPQWVPMVKRVTGSRESLNARRVCHVEMEGRTGEVTEECVDYAPRERIGWVVYHDTLGFSRLFSRLAFGFVLEPQGVRVTRLRLRAEYEPRGLLGRLMYTMMMRRKFGHLRRQMLLNIKRLAEVSPLAA
jgi:uncharacterized protein YndB with AHSA1/START domain